VYQALLVLICWACGREVPSLLAQDRLERFESRQLHMGVQARIVLWAPGRPVAEAAAAAAFARIAELDEALSDYRSESELSRLSRHAVGEPVPVSEDLFRVLRRSQELAERSAGAFDVTVGPVVVLWREARRTGQHPADSAIRRAVKQLGWRQLRLDEGARTAALGRSGMRLDLGGIAKGHACDEALRVLAQHGVTRALVELGGDLVVGEPPPGSDGWPIAVATTDTIHRVGSYARVAISASGDAEQFVAIGGRRYSHVVDPRTGQALTSRIGVTVIGPDALTSDGLATLVSVLGPDEGMAFVRRYYPAVRVWVR
jgi:thiamine biosynthesis lipoprotein